MVECSQEQCKSCKWVGHISGYTGGNKTGSWGSTLCCEYILKNGESRMFVKEGHGKKRHEANLCDMYEPGENEKKKKKGMYFGKSRKKRSPRKTLNKGAES